MYHRAMLLRYFDDDSPLIDFSKERNTGDNTIGKGDADHLSPSSVEMSDNEAT